MEFHSGVNLFLEALAYLGRRAGGYDTNWMITRIKSRGVGDMTEVAARSAPIARLMTLLDGTVKVKQERLCHLFESLPGMPYNTVGTYSRVFLLLYPLADRFQGDCDEIAAAARARTPGQLAADLAMMLDIGEESELEGGELCSRVLAMNIPAESKVAILELYHRGEELLSEAMTMLTRVVKRLQKEQALLGQCLEPFLRDIQEQGIEAVLSQSSALNSSPERTDRVIPFVFGMDTLVASAHGRIYCGVLRLPLQLALASAHGPEVEVYEAIRLLADQTRFEILCYLRSRDAYGQELAAKFGLSRNTIHHHMTKLLAAHLVKGTVDGNRVYYRADSASIERLLQRQRELLLPS